MASFEQHYGCYRIVFRYMGRKYRRSLHTSDEGAALAARTAFEQRIKLVRSGLLPQPPENCDVFEYLIRGNCVQLDDAKNEQSPKAEKPTTFGQLCSAYFDSFLRSSIEDNSFKTMELHSRHFLRLIGSDKKLNELNHSAVQPYITRRSKEPGFRGSYISPTTIRKEITTLKSILNWAKTEGHVESVCFVGIGYAYRLCVFVSAHTCAQVCVVKDLSKASARQNTEVRKDCLDGCRCVYCKSGCRSYPWATSNRLHDVQSAYGCR